MALFLGQQLGDPEVRDFRPLDSVRLARSQENIGRFDVAVYDSVLVGISECLRELLADFELKDAPTFVETKPVAKFCTEKFLNGEVDKVSVLFTHFINTISQSAVVETLLPISSFDLPKKHEGSADGEDVDPLLGYVFEPGAEVVLDSMLPYYIQYQVFQMILDARASEHSARMVAMKNATDNANEFIKDLTLEYNKMRQAGITTELLEIATAQMSLGA